MKVLLRRNVHGLGKIGEVVEAKPGYARNYLLPQRLAVEPTKSNTRKVEAEKQAYLEELARLRAQIEARAKLVDGKEITIAARANEEGQLYGSVGPAQIVAALAEKGLHVDPENVALVEPIRKLDKYDIDLKFGEDVAAKIVLWVVPIREDGTVGEAVAAAPAPAPAEDEASAEGEAPAEGAAPAPEGGNA